MAPRHNCLQSFHRKENDFFFQSTSPTSQPCSQSQFSDLVSQQSCASRDWKVWCWEQESKAMSGTQVEAGSGRHSSVGAASACHCPLNSTRDPAWSSTEQPPCFSKILLRILLSVPHIHSRKQVLAGAAIVRCH